MIPLGNADEKTCFETWIKYLEEKFTFPFTAKVKEFQDRGPLRQGDFVHVLGIDGLQMTAGILVNIRIGKRFYIFPLYDLEAKDRSSSNYQPLNDYSYWFTNR